MSIPAIIFIVIYLADQFYLAHKHGQQQEGKYSFWVGLFAKLIMVALLIWGGFF
jgi:hypothetical protein